MYYFLLYYLAFAVGINLLLYLVAYLLQTDKVTDISYAATFAAIAGAGYYFSGHSLIDLILLVMILLWAFRIGGYLFYRVLKIGHDQRFDEIRNHPLRFLTFWVMQGLTCGLVSFSFLLVMHQTDLTITPVFLSGIGLAGVGLLLETVADVQKFNFKLRHPEQFMSRGVWRRIRHPNYTGELLFWWGIFVASIPYAPLLIAVLSPVWITLILIRFSGIPILREKWDKAYGQDPDFQAYLERSRLLIPYVY
jgi:steroid 5-alpha reductase family enzyme